MIYSSFSRKSNILFQKEIFDFPEGWAQWEKYCPLFPSKEFVLKRNKSNNGVFEIFLISKQNVLKVIFNHLDTFQDCLGSQTEPQQLLQQLCYSKQDVMETLNDNSGLLGILLGYGKVNSMLFERKVNICNNINAKMTPPFSACHDIKSLQPASQNLVSLYNNGTFSYTLTPYSPSKEYCSLADELNDILLNEEIFELDGSDFFLDKVIAPVFMMHKNDFETEKLRKEYSATKHRLRHAYSQGSFLEVTLNQWIHPQ